MQSLAHQFWKRFIQEYVPTLMQRLKWRTRGRQIKVGVLLVDFNAPRGKWNLVLVKDVYPGADGMIRNVLVKANNSEFKRSFQKCCVIAESKAEESAKTTPTPGGFVINIFIRFRVKLSEAYPSRLH